MTLFPRFWPRVKLLEGVPCETRLFQVSPNAQILGICHWQPDKTTRSTLLLVHGLEGSVDSHYMRGIAHKAWKMGLNVIRMNQRNCGGSEPLTATLYNGGLSGDLRAVLAELSSRDGLDSLWVVGFSMGGNLALKMAGESGTSLLPLKGVLAVCPSIHPAACVEALQKPRNWFYHRHFLKSLKARLRRKAMLFPGRFTLSGLNDIRTLAEFDERYTAPDGGYRSAEEYYEQSGARHVLKNIQVPTWIITAQDDPMVPHNIFDIDPIDSNSMIQLVLTKSGGHCAFIQPPRRAEDMYWAENRLVALISGQKW